MLTKPFYNPKSYAKSKVNNARLELVLATGASIWLIAFVSAANKKIRTKAFVDPVKCLIFVIDNDFEVIASMSLHPSELQPINLWGSWESTIVKELDCLAI